MAWANLAAGVFSAILTIFIHKDTEIIPTGISLAGFLILVNTKKWQNWSKVKMKKWQNWSKVKMIKWQNWLKVQIKKWRNLSKVKLKKWRNWSKVKIKNGRIDQKLKKWQHWSSLFLHLIAGINRWVSSNLRLFGGRARVFFSRQKLKTFLKVAPEG